MCWIEGDNTVARRHLEYGVEVPAKMSDNALGKSRSFLFQELLHVIPADGRNQLAAKGRNRYRRMSGSDVLLVVLPFLTVRRQENILTYC